MTIFSGLLSSVILLLALGVVYDTLNIRRIKNALLGPLVSGLFIGASGIALMLMPYQFSEQLSFDAHWVLISLSALFFGRHATIVAMVMMLSFRFFQGGVGVTSGCWVIISSTILGFSFKFMRDKYALVMSWKSLYVFSIVVELNVLLAMLMLPEGLALPVIEVIAPPLLTVLPIASVLFAIFLKRQDARYALAIELKESRRLLSQESGILKGLIDNIPELVFYKSADGRYLGCNNAFCEFLAVSEQEIINHTDFDLFPTDAAQLFISDDKNVLRQQAASSSEEWVPLANGKLALLSTTKAPFYTEGGAEHGVVGICHDSTSSYLEHEKLRESELTYRSIISTTIDGFLIVSLEGVIEDANQAYVDMSGYTKEELCGMLVSDLDSIYGESDLKGLITYLIANNKKVHFSQHRRKDGSDFNVEVHITYWQSESSGKFFSFIRDVTERDQTQVQLLQSETRFRRVFESIPKIAVQGYNQQREVFFWNKASEALYGYSQKQALGKKLEDLIIPERAKKSVVTEVNDWLQGGETTSAAELTLRDANGAPITVFSTHVMINGINDQREMYCIDIDLRAQKAAEVRATTLSQAIEQSPMSVVIISPFGIIEYVNGTYERTTGYPSDQVVGRHIRELSSSLTPADIYAEMSYALNRGKPWQGEFESTRRNGETYWEQLQLAPVKDTDERISHFLAISHDITQQKQQEEKIIQQAHFDSLTGLPNRFLSLDRLSVMLADAKRCGSKAAILFLDFDDFKKVNDTLGHQVGDELLIEAAQRLSSVVRDNDVVGRLGGDEFIVLVRQESEASTAVIVAEKLLEQFRKPFILSGREFVSTVSIGIAIYPEDGQTPAELLRQADSAMYHSKDGGRNTYHFYTAKMNADIARRVLIEEQLRLALGRGELNIHYQPFIELSTQSIVGAEALIRWENPQLGCVGPDEFIPIAEQTGLIVDIGLFVLKKSIEQVVKWRQHFHQEFSVAINVSPIQFRDSVLKDEVFRLLAHHQLPASAIELEVTEGVLVSGYANVETCLNEFNQRGIRIAMDDFGTGYSSLSYLRQYPFDTLKVDKSFVQDINTDNSDRELVSAAICMGHGLNMKVVAEGIETQQQLDLLNGLGCDIGQGYYLGRPVDAAEFEQLHFNL